ncbi:MAG: hypothetical protein H6739_06970 [Alphaproteobacteria bacterium]|nr:hypothetical protein [Alphaproteobacteria bacterium]
MERLLIRALPADHLRALVQRRYGSAFAANLPGPSASPQLLVAGLLDLLEQTALPGTLPTGLDTFLGSLLAWAPGHAQQVRDAASDLGVPLPATPDRQLVEEALRDTGRWLPAQWFSEHLVGLQAQVGPRGVPDVSISALQSAFGALLGQVSWTTLLGGLLRDVQEHEQAWARLPTAQADSWGPAFPQDARADGEALHEALQMLREGLEALHGSSGSTPGDIEQLVEDCQDAASRCLSATRRAFEAEHGPGTSRSRDVRQRMVAVLASFPDLHITRCEDLLDWLWGFPLDGVIARIARERTALLTGPAGTGKTFALLKLVREQIQEGGRAVLLLGRGYRGGPAWHMLRDRLGLPASCSEEQLFEILEQNALATGRPLLIAVDALNESVPRRAWRDELSGLLAQVRRRPTLRLLLSCRTGFVPRVMPAHADLPAVDHPGFQGQEFTAVREFFGHFELEPPPGPTLLPEYSNPLFLSLVCKALVSQGLLAVPAGWRGLQEVLRAVFDGLDARLQDDAGWGTRNVVHRALLAFVGACATRGTRSLPEREADAVLQAALPAAGHSLRMLDWLVDEDVLRRDPGLPSDDDLLDPEDEIVLSYDRLRDHLVADMVLRGLSESTPGAIADLRSSLSDSTGPLNDPGILEALALLVPERLGVELLDLFQTDAAPREAAESWLRALPSRNPATFSSRTERWLQSCIRNRVLCLEAVDAMLQVAVRPEHPLDARWMNTWMLEQPMPDRDAWWCEALHVGYQAGDERRTSALRCLLEQPWDERTQDLDAAQRVNWLLVLGWCMAAADRRVRDTATKAAVRLTEGRPELWSRVLPHLLAADDDYVVERVLACTYGALLRCPEPDVLRAVVEVLDRPESRAQLLGLNNAIILDYPWLIVSLAHAHAAVPPAWSGEDFRLPRPASRPTIPTEEELDQRLGPIDSPGLDRLRESCLNEFWGDFAIYTVPWALERDESVVTIEEARRWILGEVLRLGYTDGRFGDYDAEMIRRYGSQRGRPAWAERVGKKLQRIALARLVSWVEALSGEPRRPHFAFRDIDPSLLVQPPGERQPQAWWMPIQVQGLDEDISDAAWVGRQAFPASQQLLQPRSQEGQRWRPLAMWLQWKGPRDGQRGPQRDMWIHIHGHLVRQADREAAWRWLSSLGLLGHWTTHSVSISNQGFVGEYPAPSLFPTLQEPDEPHPGCPAVLRPTVLTIDQTYEEDCWQSGVVHAHVPDPIFFAGNRLRWRGRADYVVAGTDRLVFQDPSLRASGPPALLADEDHLQGWLEAQGLALLWAIVGERRVLGEGHRRHSGMLNISQVARLEPDGSLTLSAPRYDHFPASSEE